MLLEDIPVLLFEELLPVVGVVSSGPALGDAEVEESSEHPARAAVIIMNGIIFLKKFIFASNRIS